MKEYSATVNEILVALEKSGISYFAVFVSFLKDGTVSVGNNVLITAQSVVRSVDY